MIDWDLWLELDLLEKGVSPAAIEAIAGTVRQLDMVMGPNWRRLAGIPGPRPCQHCGRWTE